MRPHSEMNWAAFRYPKMALRRNNLALPIAVDGCCWFGYSQQFESRNFFQIPSSVRFLFATMQIWP
ncbi:hypothetical protein HNQ77_005207 [Silvibacterium bohemicum]|uniref:Uncharacterized protein n=1 Tax=Silvibacterium bohemicum TaxID=1577686 RepID=A0A841K0C6_9BACT|nr:hypothetical protein [Silvibacterium bohemicum]